MLDSSLIILQLTSTTVLQIVGSTSVVSKLHFAQVLEVGCGGGWLYDTTMVKPPKSDRSVGRVFATWSTGRRSHLPLYANDKVRRPQEAMSVGRLVLFKQ